MPAMPPCTPASAAISTASSPTGVRPSNVLAKVVRTLY
jgi:hypothetical protein